MSSTIALRSFPQFHQLRSSMLLPMSSMCRRQIFASLLILGACGYQPVYRGGDGGPVATDLASVEIGLVPNRVGQELRNELIDRMYRHGRPSLPAYRLDLQVVVSESRSGYRKDATATRGQVLVNAVYTLRNADGDVVLSARNDAVAGFSVVEDQYGILVNEEDAYGRATEQLAEDIVRRLSLHFQR